MCVPALGCSAQVSTPAHPTHRCTGTVCEQRIHGASLSFRWKGGGAMTYGRVALATYAHAVGGAAVSHSAELVRGHFIASDRRPPHPALRATFSPKGEGPSRHPHEGPAT